MAHDTLVPLPFGGYAVIPAIVAVPPEPRPPTPEERAYVVAACRQMLSGMAAHEVNVLRGRVSPPS